MKLESLPRVLVFGESENDTATLRELILALCPGVKVEVRRRPIVLIKNARPENVRPQADQIARAVAVEEVRGPVACVFAHKDSDCVEPGDVNVATSIEAALGAALTRAGVHGCHVHAAVPAWETENWLLLWPDVIGEYMRSWRTPSEYEGRSVGLVRNGKEELARAVRPPGLKRGQRWREYRESDAPMIARSVRNKGLATTPRGTSASYARFRNSVDACCEAAR